MDDCIENVSVGKDSKSVELPPAFGVKNFALQNIFLGQSF